MDCIAHGVTKSWTRLSDFHTSRKKKDKEPGTVLQFGAMHHLLPGLRSLCGKAETALGKAQRTLIS